MLDILQEKFITLSPNIASIEYLRNTISSSNKQIFWGISLFIIIYVLYLVRQLTIIVVASYVIALVLDPVVSFLEKRKIPRGVSILFIFLSLAFVFLAFLLSLVPFIITELTSLISKLPDYMQVLEFKADDYIKNSLGIEIHAREKILPVLKSYVLEIKPEQVRTFIQSLIQTLLKGLSLLSLFIFPVLIFYITLDLKKIHAFIKSFMHPRLEGLVTDIGGKILKTLYSFLEGQVLVCLCMFALYSFGLWLAGVPYALLIGVLGGLCEMVPYLGFTSVSTASMLVILFNGYNFFPFGVIVLVVITLIQIMENFLIVPKIIGGSVGLHPLVIILTLLIGGSLIGFFGVVIAVPLAATLKVLFYEVLSRVDVRKSFK